ncbi:MAG: calcineurin-like phosphoesterase family protein [Gammaproteobacteria bacterium]|nr:calcineurin-like phosphoesterase family protein [Gammaproteobacteria bacterium]
MATSTFIAIGTGNWKATSAIVSATVNRLGTGLLLALLAASGLAAESITGRIFEDLNYNGTWEPGEPGIAGVRVSNGEDVEVSDEAGDYELDVPDEAVIFITKPRGYATPVNEDQLPQFYYIHQPEGSPDGLRYLGIEPTGPLPEAINFPLLRHDEPNSFEALLFADTQPQTEVELDFIRDDVIAELIGTNASFGMTMGDILFDDMSLFPRFNRLIGKLGIPWYNVPGNHEINLLAEDDRYSLETFKRYFGPPYYAFEYGDALFVVLDNIEYRGNGESDPGDVRGNGGYIANFGKRQLAWLQEELSHVPKDRLIFMGMHAPLATYMNDGAGVNTADRRDLFKLLSGRPNLYAVAGHTHTTEHRYFGEDDGFKGPGELHHHVLTTVSGSWWSGPFDPRGIPTTDQRDGTPNGYHVLEVDGSDLSIRYKAAGHSADYQMRILFDVVHHGLRKDGMRDYRNGELFDSRFSEDQVPAAEILVNLFDGGPKSVVEFSVEGGDYLPMQRVTRPDPYMLEVFARNPDSKKSWLQATPSSHIFSADLPDDISAGTYTVAVRARDEFGREHHGHAVLEITGR